MYAQNRSVNRSKIHDKNILNRNLLLNVSIVFFLSMTLCESVSASVSLSDSYVSDCVCLMSLSLYVFS